MSLFERGGKSVRTHVVEQLSLLHRMNLRPWYINIDAEWWEEAKREWSPGDGPMYGDPERETFLGLPVLVWAPGSRASAGVTVQAYPPGREPQSRLGALR